MGSSWTVVSSTIQDKSYQLLDKDVNASLFIDFKRHSSNNIGIRAFPPSGQTNYISLQPGDLQVGGTYATSQLEEGRFRAY